MRVLAKLTLIVGESEIEVENVPYMVTNESYKAAR
jgi:hypothetical protein